MATLFLYMLKKQKWNCLTIARLATTNCCLIFSLLLLCNKYGNSFY